MDRYVLVIERRLIPASSNQIILVIEVDKSVEGDTENDWHARTLGDEPFDKTAATKGEKTIADHTHDWLLVRIRSPSLLPWLVVLVREQYDSKR